ncbi:hypothetical protein ACUOFC_10145 [Escherichia sp. TWPC-MK]
MDIVAARRFGKAQRETVRNVGKAFHHQRAARQVIHWSMTGDNQKLYRWRCRAATYANWPTLRYMLRGNTVSDAPLIIGSLDPCYSCTDRMTVVDVRKKKSKVVPYKELERYSIERKNSPLK